MGYTYDDRPVTAGDLKAAGAMTALLRNALKPNLVQTLEGTPAFVHGGPFANIAHGCNSVIATRMALKMHGGLAKNQLGEENFDALEAGIPNLLRHVSNIRDVYGLPCVVAVNRFPTDTDREIDCIIEKCRALGVNTVLSTVWADGGRGGEALAREVVRLCEEEQGHFAFTYADELPLKEKIEAVVKRIYHGKGVNFLPAAEKQLATLTALGFGGYPVCIAKTQYSFSDDPTKLGAPEDFTVTVKNVRVSAGAGFVVVLTGDIMTMPGLPRVPAAEKIDVDENGRISGLF